MNKQYLGDGVYAEIDRDWYVKLTTENGIEVTNTIYLEREVLDALLHYLREIKVIK
jgi:hypothetical protein